MTNLKRALPTLRWLASSAVSLAHSVHAAKTLAAKDLPSELANTLKHTSVECWGDVGGLAGDVIVTGAWQVVTAIPDALVTTFLVLWWGFETWHLYRQAKGALCSWSKTRKATRDGSIIPQSDGHEAMPQPLSKVEPRPSRRRRRRERGKRKG